VRSISGFNDHHPRESATGDALHCNWRFRFGRLAQAEELLRLGIGVSDETHIVAQEDGKAIHSYVSHLLASNVHPKIEQERFGHSSIMVTRIFTRT
jgi:site-specific recombinase XerC